MNNASEPGFQGQTLQGQTWQGQTLQGQALQGRAIPDGAPGVLKAMSPGVVDFLFRQLVTGESAEDLQWHREGTALSAQTPGAELARRLAETDLEALTPTELFHYVRASQRLSAWAESLREHAVSRYCATPSADASPPQ
ncbi:hypothetical protein [Arthrobacter sp. UYEF20]|uniref:hypothetical protein n=1 Tax=Arthrobacter sp. UYEF20 TaxID=1756363 RepID=UPI0033908155